MKKKVLAVLLIAAMLTGCGNAASVDTNSSESTSDQEAETVQNENKTDSANSGTDIVPISTKESLLGSEETIYYDQGLVPSIPEYKVEPGLTNVVIHPSLKYRLDISEESEYNHPQALIDKLSENSFAIIPGYAEEFFDVYEGNRYGQIPNFITVDSLMHTYHLYFAHLMKTSEKTYLADELKSLGADMLRLSEEQFEALKGTEWENAARRNVAFFYIGSLLQDEATEIPTAALDDESICRDEYDKIMAAAGIDDCALTGLVEDYSQYKVRGYYEGDEQLEKYFRAMMWYGRIGFVLDNEDMVKSAILQTCALSTVQDKWDGIYKITSFFAGASDDPGFIEFNQILTDVYGQISDVQGLSADSASLNEVMNKVRDLKMPQINSVPVEDGDNPVIPTYRFMGQRFTVDAAIMQRLVYSSVKENSNGEKRYLPDVLDTPAALGSDEALKILEEKGATDYEGYTDNLTIMSEHFNNDDATLWNASLYSGWLNTLRPLLEEKGQGYPSYMHSSEWNKKNLETFAGSYTELKHDTVLYAKQIMAEMGGGDEEVLDDRGYVDPQPVVYSRFKFLSEKTKEGLDGYGMLSDSSRENLDKLSEIAGTLLAISEKELKNEELSDDDYEFIRSYGGYIEHFWREANQDNLDEELYDSNQAPCEVVTDIATDPNGTVLEIGTGRVDTIYVVFPIDGELHVAVGGAYSFYQFEESIDNRLTDSQWRNMMRGGYLDDNWDWITVENKYERADWTKSYRVDE